MRACWLLCAAVVALASAGCGGGGGAVRDPAVRGSAEGQIRLRVLAEMRAAATPLDGPPFRVEASCPEQTGSGSGYTLSCRATGYERRKALRRISGVPLTFEVASERWSVGVRNGRVSTVRRARGRSIPQAMRARYNFACGDGSSSSGDPACH